MLKTGFFSLFLVTFTCCALAQPVRTPVASTEYKGLYERVLSLPGAALMEQPSAKSKVKVQQLPVFGIYYVYGRRTEEGQEWVEIGQTSRQPDGWISARASERWTLMLVMQFASPGQRNPVPFFRELEPLQQLVNTPNLPLAMKELGARIEAGGDPRIAAMEPLDAVHGLVSTRTNYYLMPVLAANPTKVEFNGQDTTLVQVASIQAQSERAQPPVQRMQKIGMVFVLDTTTSMGKYIDLVRTFTRTLFGQLSGQINSENVGVGVLGYRNNIQLRPKLEYLTRQFLPLTTGLSAANLDATLSSITEATTSSHSFSEDAFAGVYEGLKSFDWESYDTRILFLLTDAGALRGNDKAAHYPNVDAVTLASLARSKHILIVPIHLQTPEAAKARNVDGARQQYLQLSDTGSGSNSYIPIAGGSVEQLSSMLSPRSAQLSSSLLEAIRGELKQPPPVIEAEPSFNAVVINELFAGQLRFIGDQNRTGAPVLRRAWASDHDLGALTDTTRETRALDVKVFLTRAQLNDLGQHVQFILDGLGQPDTTASKVLNQLQSLSTAMSSDPGRFGGQFDQFGRSDVLPAYLAKLPYKSPVLQLTGSIWQAMGTERNSFLDELRFKLAAYREFDLNKEAWKDLGSHDDLQAVFAIPLELLP